MDAEHRTDFLTTDRRRSVLVLLLFGALLSCDAGQRANPVRDAFAQEARGLAIGASVAFRFPTVEGSDIRLYRLPGLEPVMWRFEAGDTLVERVVGFAGDDDLVYTLTAARELVALDLTSGRARVIDTNVTLATMGPTGVPFTVRADSSIATIARRKPLDWSTRLPALPTAAWGAVRNRLIALMPVDDGVTLQLLADGQEPISQRLPAGHLAVSKWGDVAAVATDSGLVVLDPTGASLPQFLRLDSVPQLATFSASAHRIYAVTLGGELLSVDRFDLQVVRRLQLPGPAGALRPDLMGRSLLVRPTDGDTVWVVDLTEWAVVTTVRSAWDDHLPTVAPDGTILLRHPDEIVAFSMDSAAVVGRALDDPRDRWLIAVWDPRRPVLELGSDTARVEEPPGQLIYVQVSSTSNQAWADDLARNLGRAGMSASVLPPTSDDEPYRVVLGPYPTRQAAEAMGQKLGLPFWIFIHDTTSVNPPPLEP